MEFKSILSTHTESQSQTQLQQGIQSVPTLGHVSPHILVRIEISRSPIQTSSVLFPNLRTDTPTTNVEMLPAAQAVGGNSKKSINKIHI